MPYVKGLFGRYSYQKKAVNLALETITGDFQLAKLYKRQSRKMNFLQFTDPVACVYNPLDYAWTTYESYLKHYGQGFRKFVVLGMNPGPFGMAQTGIPFGDPAMVSSYLEVDHYVGKPKKEHPKRPVSGFQSARKEVSGQRLWGWIQNCFPDADSFFGNALILNYCPLIFMEESGRNLTPDKLPAKQRQALEKLCDEGLKDAVRILQPEWLIAMGKWTLKKAKSALSDYNPDLKYLTLSHPSPASPKANRGWESLIENELSAAGITCWKDNR